MNTLEENAKQFATYHHQKIGHKRKYTGECYTVHLQGVVDILKTVTDDEEMIAAAWMHDTLEDTKATYEEIKLHFGKTIANYVLGLTDKSKPEDGNRAERKEIDRLHLSRECRQVQTIKYADLIDNTSSIVKHDPDFAKIYLAEKELLLLEMSDGEAFLRDKAWDTLRSARKELGFN